MAQSNETSWYGASMAVKTISIKTNAALGTLAEAMLAAVEVNLKEKCCLLRNTRVYAPLFENQGMDYLLKIL